MKKSIKIDKNLLPAIEYKNLNISFEDFRHDFCYDNLKENEIFIIFTKKDMYTMGKLNHMGGVCDDCPAEIEDKIIRAIKIEINKGDF